MEELYTTAEVSKILKVDYRTVSRWLKKGKIPGIKIGREWRIRKQDMESLINPFRRGSAQSKKSSQPGQSLESVLKEGDIIIEPLEEGQVKPDFLDTLRLAEEEIKEGKFLTWEEAKKELGE